MHLVLDLGNTNHKAAVFDQDSLMELFNFQGLAIDHLEGIFRKYPAIKNSILSSVILHPDPLEQFLRKHSHLIILGKNTPVPCNNLYLTPETLGRDRLAAAVGACHLFPGSDVLAINMGTCITYDFVDASGNYRGGSISPGMQMRFRALNTFTGKLPLIVYRDSDILTGRTTEESILSGVINGIVAEIEGIAAGYRSDFPDLKVILSGGDLNNFDKRLKISTFAVPNIVIVGLQKILAFNVEKLS